MTADVLVIGEALVDEVTAPGQPPVCHVGGSPANVALGLGSLGHPVTLATDIGADEHGRRIAERCLACQVTLAPGSVGPRPTGVAHARLDDQGVASYTFDLSWAPPLPTGLHGFGHVHTGSLAATMPPGADTVRDVLRGAHPHATVSYDPNIRPALMPDQARVRARVEELIGLADVVKASEPDAAWLYPELSIAQVLARWGRLGPALVVLTRGADGVWVRDAHGEVTGIPLPEPADGAPRPTVVDTVGAGDAWMAGLLSGLLDAGLLGGPAARHRLASADLPALRSALDRAMASAACCVAHAGAYFPTRSELASAESWADARPRSTGRQ